MSEVYILSRLDSDIDIGLDHSHFYSKLGSYSRCSATKELRKYEEVMKVIGRTKHTGWLKSSETGQQNKNLPK